MIDDYKYMYLYKPLYMDVYIKDCIDIYGFIFISLYRYSKIFAILQININGLYQRSSSMVI